MHNNALYILLRHKIFLAKNPTYFIKPLLNN